VTEAGLDFVSVKEANDDRDDDTDPVGLAVPELVLVTFGFVAVTVGLIIGVRVCFDATVELGDALDDLEACRVLV
jgi:hypothetical protein